MRQVVANQLGSIHRHSVRAWPAKERNGPLGQPPFLDVRMFPRTVVVSELSLQNERQRRPRQTLWLLPSFRFALCAEPTLNPGIDSIRNHDISHINDPAMAES